MTDIDCDNLIDRRHSEARDQIELALLAKAVDVASMHLDLAEFSERRADVAKEICLEA